MTLIFCDFHRQYQTKYSQTDLFTDVNTLGMGRNSRIWTPNVLISSMFNHLVLIISILFSKLVCAEVSKITGASKRVFHQTVNAQNSILTKEIHDQGKIIILKYFIIF